MSLLTDIIKNQQATIESLRQQLAAMTAERDMWARAFKNGGTETMQKQVLVLRQLIPRRIPDGFVSLGKYYAEQEDKFNDPYNSMCKFKRKYLSDCEEALAATEPKP